MDLIERVESYKVMFKECKALEPVSTALAKGYKSGYTSPEIRDNQRARYRAGGGI